MNDRREVYRTSIIASDDERARGAHWDEALFRAGVWGLRGPLRVVGVTVGMSTAAPVRRHLRCRPWRQDIPDAGPAVAAEGPGPDVALTRLPEAS